MSSMMTHKIEKRGGVDTGPRAGVNFANVKLDHGALGRLVNDTCKYYRRYRYRYVLLKVSTIPIPILLQKLAAILLPITFDDATCDRNYVGLPQYFLTIIKNDIIDDSLTRKTNSKRILKYTFITKLLKTLSQCGKLSF